LLTLLDALGGSAANTNFQKLLLLVFPAPSGASSL
jgi:hypothetical protein